MTKTVTLYGPKTSKISFKNAYGGGSGGYTRNMATLLNYFRSNNIVLTACYHTFRGQLKLDYFFWRMFIDTVTFITNMLKNKPDAIHILAQYRSALPREYMVILVSKLFSVPVMYEIKAGAFIDAYTDRSAIYRWMIRKVIERSTKILCEGNMYISFLKEEFQTESEYFPNVVPDELVAMKPRKILNEEFIQVLFVGYCYEGKGVKLLVQACNIAAEKGKKIRLTFVGEEHRDFTEWLDAYIFNENLKIIRLGRQPYEMVLSEFSQRDVYCYPTSHQGEGHNNTINEALMSGLYVITTQQGFLSDIITENRGSSLTSLEPFVIAKELIWIANNRDEARKKAQKGKQYLIDNFMTSTNFERLDCIYNDLVNQKYEAK